jgi:hypothetical protein
MPDEYAPDWITRIDTAKRQIRTAVRLHFERCDPVTLHTLVTTAHRLISELTTTSTPNELVKVADLAAEFFGSAVGEQQEGLNIEPLPRLTPDLLFYAILNLQTIVDELPFEARIYWAWFMHTRPDGFAGAGPAVSGLMTNTEQLKSMSFYEIRQLLRFQQTLNLSEPFPEWASINPEPPPSEKTSRPTEAEVEDSNDAPRLSDSEVDSAYDKYRRSFRNAVGDCQAVSRLVGGREIDGRRWWASLLFTRLCVTAMSLLKILPESPLERSSSKQTQNPLELHWDFTAVAVLARTLLENHITLFYLGLEDVDEDEWLSRLNLMQLHDHYSRKATFGPSSGGSKPGDFDVVVEDLEQKLRAKKFFQSLASSQQREFLKGKRASFFSHEEILTRMGRKNAQEYIAVWRWWSSYVHSFPLSYYRMPEHNRGTGVENRADKRNMASALATVTTEIESATSGMRRLFPDIPSRDQIVSTIISEVVNAQRSATPSQEGNTVEPKNASDTEHAGDDPADRINSS